MPYLRQLSLFLETSGNICDSIPNQTRRSDFDQKLLHVTTAPRFGARRCPTKHALRLQRRQCSFPRSPSLTLHHTLLHLYWYLSHRLGSSVNRASHHPPIMRQGPAILYELAVSQTMFKMLWSQDKLWRWYGSASLKIREDISKDEKDACDVSL